MTTERIENMAGGQGHVLIKRLLNEKQLNGKCGLYSEVTLEPGCSLGYHEHHNESDVTFTPDGQGHGMTNTGDEDLVFMALIILD